MRFSNIVFIQDGEDGDQADILFNVEGIVAHGVTAESFAAVLEYLKQWDSGEDFDVTDTLPAGSSDTVLFEDDANPYRDGAYIISANLGLGYVGLSRVINDDDNTEGN